MVHTHTAVHHSQQALKMNGAFIKLTPEDFQNLLNRNENLAVAVSKASFFKTTYTYVTSHKGLIFYCKHNEQLSIPSKHETINTSSISLPVM